METVTTTTGIRRDQAKYEVVLNSENDGNKSIVVIIPTHNNGPIIGSLILKILQFHVTAIVIDDGSIDDTGFIAELAGATVIRLEGSQGKSSAVKAGIQKAIELSPDVIVIMEGDGQHLAEELPDIVKPILDNQADIVVGSRYFLQARRTPAYRIVGHKVFQWLAGVTSGITISDPQSGYRAFSPHALVLVNNVRRDFPVGLEMSYISRNRRLRIMDVPITTRSSSLRQGSGWLDAVTDLTHVINLTARYRPLLFFSALGLLVLAAGVVAGVLVVEEFSQTNHFPLRNTLMSAVFLIIGWTSFLTGLVLHAVRTALKELRV